MRNEIREKLAFLREECGCVSIKAEFEAEGARKDELIMLRDFVEVAGLGLIIKIGGCEAVHDIDQCKLLGATGIMAPMIETPFAMKKFRSAVARRYGDEPDVERIINAETITCLQNFDQILDEGEGFLTGVTVGRSDLSASMGISRKDIEGERVFQVTQELCSKSAERGYTTNFGGNIGLESVLFIQRMSPWIDRYETRKVVLTACDDSEILKQSITSALEFELLYLHYKADYYNRMAKEDFARIGRLERQIHSNM